MRILIATDFSADAQSALHLISRLQFLTRSEVTLLHVVGRTSDFSRAARDQKSLRDFFDRIRIEAEKKLQRDEEWLRGHGANVTMGWCGRVLSWTRFEQRQSS